jgi:hypothetical protein
MKKPLHLQRLFLKEGLNSRYSAATCSLLSGLDFGFSGFRFIDGAGICVANHRNNCRCRCAEVGRNRFAAGNFFQLAVFRQNAEP